jgi:murein DD-endopeptidase MepM/ murein hydrolase activator NlpD
MLNKTEYISQVSLYDYNILKELKSAREQVANLKQKLDKDLESNEAMQKEVNSQKETMETLVEEKSKQLSEYETTIAGQQAEVDKYAQAQAEAEAIIAAAEQAASTSATSTYTGGIFTWPAPGNYTITSYFGNRTSPTAGASTNHKGLDIACSTGDNIVAAASGTVIVATYNYAEGNYICIDHGGGVVTVYMHNSQLYVSVGEAVTAGQTIAAAGSTGYSTGPHCHFGVRVDGTYVDPLGYLQ